MPRIYSTLPCRYRCFTLLLALTIQVVKTLTDLLVASDHGYIDTVLAALSLLDTDSCQGPGSDPHGGLRDGKAWFTYKY